MLDSVSVILPQNMSLYFPVRILCWGISMKEYVLLCTRTNVRVKSQGIESARSILITRMCLVLSGFEGNFGVHHVTPRNLSSSLVNKLPPQLDLLQVDKDTEDMLLLNRASSDRQLEETKQSPEAAPTCRFRLSKKMKPVKERS